MQLTTYQGKNFCSFHRPLLIFQPTVNSWLAINKGGLCLEQHYSLKNCMVAMCRHINKGIWSSLGGGGGRFWLCRETLAFMCPAAYQKTAVIQIGVNKIPTNSNTLFVTSLYGVWLFKGLNTQHIYMFFSDKGLKDRNMR
jgi:hypothetical protein